MNQKLTNHFFNILGMPEEVIGEELDEYNFVVPEDSDYDDSFQDDEEQEIEVASLWENIRKKKEREGKNYRPAKPGDKDRPDPEAWKKAQSSEGEMAKQQIEKMHKQLMEVAEKLKSLEVEFEDWTADMISKSELYIQNVYDFVMFYKPEEEDEEESEAKAAEYKGRKVTLNKPFRTPKGPKKFAVYTKNESGNVVIVRFGDSSSTIKKDDPERRKSFRARHNCDNPGPKWKARYWSCRNW